MSGWKDLFHDIKSIEIRQKIDIAEILTGLEFENQYEIRLKSDEGDKIKWKAKEKSEWFSRQCLNPRQRAFDINIYDDDKNKVMQLQKDFNLNFCDLCCLPEMKMKDKENDKTLGYITLNPNCLPMIDLNVLDNDKVFRFRIVSDACPLAMMCNNTVYALCFQEMDM
mmetsp:Transcript_43439/g.36397  ORF Transcript_43439/g.36397 Transcript_43439/m.36397 type:complete len:167 (-) Transcript_43439:373-873(-)